MLLAGDFSADPEFSEVWWWIKSNVDGAAFLGANNVKRKQVVGSLGMGAAVSALFFPPALIPMAGAVGAIYVDERREVIRSRRFAFWQRADPVAHLAPGTSRRVTTTLTTGLSYTASAELVQSLGLEAELGMSVVGSKARAATKQEQTMKLAASVTGTTQTSESRSDEISNPHSDRHRVVAIWRPRCALLIDRLIVATDRLSWKPFRRYEYDVDASLATTSRDLPV